MKFFGVALVAGALIYVLVQNNWFKPAAPPPPPPPPPAILLEPAPVISEEEIARVEKSAFDTDPLVRWEAVVYLDKIKSPKAFKLMEEMLRKDSDSQLRMRIITLFGTRNTPEILEALSGRLIDQEPEVRLAALEALQKIGDYSVASAIADRPLHDQDERVRVSAMKVLNYLQDKRQKEIDAAKARYEADKAAAAAAASPKK